MTGAATTDSPRVAEALRRATIALAAVLVIVLPHLPTPASLMPGSTEAAAAEVVRNADHILITTATTLAAWLVPALLVASWAAGGRVHLPRPSLALPVAALAAAAAISTVYGAVDPSAAAIRSAQMVGFAVAALAVAQAIRSHAERRVLAAAVVASGVLVAVEVLRTVIGAGAVEPDERLAAGVLVMMLAIGGAVGFLIEKWRDGGRGPQVMAGLVACMVLVMAASLAGLGLAILLTAFLLVPVMMYRRRDPWTRWRALSAALSCFALAVFLMAMLWPVFRKAVLPGWAAPLGDVTIFVENKVVGAGFENLKWFHRLLTSVENAPLAFVPIDLEKLFGVLGAGVLITLIVACLLIWMEARKELQGEVPSRGRNKVVGAFGWLTTVWVPAAGTLIVAWTWGRDWLATVAAGLAALGLAVVLGILLGRGPKRLEVPTEPSRRVVGGLVAGFWGMFAWGFVLPAVFAPPVAVAAMATLAMFASRPAPTEGRRIGVPLKALLVAAVMGAAFVGVRFFVLPVKAEAWHVARAARTANLPALADEHLRLAARANPRDWVPPYRRGLLWETEAAEARGIDRATPREKAVAAYREALERNPRLAAAHRGLARLWMLARGGDIPADALERAREHLERATRLDPLHPLAWARLGEVQERRGDPSGAHRAWKKALEMHEAGVRPQLTREQAAFIRERLGEEQIPVAPGTDGP